MLGVTAVMLGAALSAVWAADRYSRSRKSGETAKRILATLESIQRKEQQLVTAMEEIQRELAIVKVRAATIPTDSSICN